MTSTTASTTTASTTTASTATSGHPVVDRFLAAVRSGQIAHSEGLYTATTVVDAVVPGWRFPVRGDEAIRAEYGRWFNNPATMDEVTRRPVGDDEVVEYTLTFTEDGVVHGLRHVHVFEIDPALDRIVSDHVWCGGRWPAPLLAEMEAAAVAPGTADVAG